MEGNAMKSTFWMTAQETEDEIKSRQVLTPFVSPFCEHVRFCKEHNEHTDVVTVNRCEFCYCEAFRAGREAGKIDRVRGYRSEYSSLVERVPSYTQCYAKGYNEGCR
jgi:hypothetical protein